MTHEYSAEFDLATEEQTTEKEGRLTVRLDKWLWAARFFKTRPLARLAIEKKDIVYNGHYTKSNQEVHLNDVIRIKQRGIEKIFVIKGLSTRRRNTEEAAPLFEEVDATQIAEQFRTRPSWHTSPTDRNQSARSPRRTLRFLRRGNHRNMGTPNLTQFSKEPIYFEPHT